MVATRVEAMTPASLGLAPTNTDLVRQAAVICGPRGCVHRPTPVHRRPLWWNSWGGQGWGGPGWAGGWNTWNGCGPGWTIQGGRCAPYRWGWGGTRPTHVLKHRRRIAANIVILAYNLSV